MNLVNNRPSSPPSALWYVTNGTSVVGPIETTLLLRGIASARIPSDCRVAQSRWPSWRRLDDIREAALMSRTPEWLEADEVADNSGMLPHISDELVLGARDAGGALLLAMHAVVAATRATAALVHRHREPFVGLVTSSAHGVLAENRLGEVVARHDAAWLSACDGRSILGTPADGPAERAIARRFANGAERVAGVAMVPVFDGGLLLAMIELARADHPFRARDAEPLQRVAELICRK